MTYIEERNPNLGLDGLFECNEQKVTGLQSVVNAHIHEHFEVLYCTAGRYELVVEKKTMILSKGDLVLIRPMQPHQTRTLHDGDNRYIVLKFIPDGLFSSMQPIYEMKYIFPFIHAGRQDVEFYYGRQLTAYPMDSLLRTLLYECTQKPYGYEMAMRAYVEQVLLWFIRQWHTHGDSMQMDERDLKTIKSVLEMIETRFDEPLTVEQLARHCSMGRSTFSRFFNQSVGESLPAYLRRLRLTKAANLLLQTDRTITEVAAETGFSSASYLVVCFQEQNGMTPKQFRHNAKRSQSASIS